MKNLVGLVFVGMYATGLGLILLAFILKSVRVLFDKTLWTDWKKLITFWPGKTFKMILTGAALIFIALAGLGILEQ